jgi:acetyl-CoA carboxylase beta subunit
VNTIDCNKCGYSFDLEDARCGTIEKGDLLVQYFCCPNCRKKYHAFTSDARMRALVEQRKAVQLKIRAAFTKKFRKKTIQEYERELDRIKQQQKKLLPGLKAAGEKILRQAENTSEGVQNAETIRDNTTGPN